MSRGMKRLLTLLLCAGMALSLCACGGSAPETSAAPERGDEALTSGVVSIDGICVDDSYVEEEGSPLKMVYLLYTVTAADSNLETDSKYTELTINDSNTYESEHYGPEQCKYMSSYYYSSYIEDVYVGTSLKVAATFKIPEGDLAPGRTITLSDSQIPDMEALRLSTDDIQRFADQEEMAQAMDPEGYAAEMNRRAEADADTQEQVKSLINGYYWSCYLNSITYELEFWAKDNFEVRTSLGTSSTGTYSVRNGYIFCTYPRCPAYLRNTSNSRRSISRLCFSSSCGEKTGVRFLTVIVRSPRTAVLISLSYLTCACIKSLPYNDKMC